MTYPQPNPPIKQAQVDRKWRTTDGMRSMAAFWDVIVRQLNALLRMDLEIPRNVRNGLYSIQVSWAETGPPAAVFAPGQVEREALEWLADYIPPPEGFPYLAPLTMTPGQVFEQILLDDGLKPVSGGERRTFWTGSWGHALHEGYLIMTCVNGWNVVWREDKSKGVSYGPHRARLKYDPKKEWRGKGWFSSEVSSAYVRRTDDSEYLQIYANNMYAIRQQWHHPQAYLTENRYDDYATAVGRIIDNARVVADFMNHLEFHQLEHIKLQLRRSKPGKTSGTYKFERLATSQERALAEEAYVLADVLDMHPDVIESFYALAKRGDWDAQDSISWAALQIGGYPPKGEKR